MEAIEGEITAAEQEWQSDKKSTDMEMVSGRVKDNNVQCANKEQMS